MILPDGYADVPAGKIAGGRDPPGDDGAARHVPIIEKSVGWVERERSPPVADTRERKLEGWVRGVLASDEGEG